MRTALPGGTTVTVLLEEQAVAVLSPEDQAEPSARMAAAEPGDVVEYDSVDENHRMAGASPERPRHCSGCDHSHRVFDPLY